MSSLLVSVMSLLLAQDAPKAAHVLKVGDAVEGEVTADTSVVHTPTLDKGYVDAPVRGVSFRADLPAGPSTIELRSYFFDAYLVVRDAKGALVAEDDDGLLRTHAQIVVAPVTAAQFQVTACALHGAVGAFELRVTPGRKPTIDPRQRMAAEIEDARRGVELVEVAMGPAHPATATSLSDLGALLYLTRKYEEARPLVERALAIREKALGPDHPDTATCLCNLATLIQSTGKHEEARPLLERALAIREKALGPDHPDTATCLCYLAMLLQSTRKYEEARPLFGRALAIREKALGPGHPDTATSLSELAKLLYATGKSEEARPLFERALAIREKVLGPEHLDTARSLNDLAALLQSTGKTEEARLHLERALAIREKTLGPEHPDTATSLHNLAFVLYSTGKYEEARPLYERALAIRERTQGPEHPDTARSLNGLAALLQLTGKYEEARPLYERALAIKEKTLGPEHLDTATSLDNLAFVLYSTGKFEEARPLFERALTIREKALGPEHPDTARCLNNLASMLDSTGKYEEARPLFERALAISEKALGPEHPDTALSLNNLASLLDSTGKHEEARPLYVRALAIFEKVLGPEHPLTATSLNNLAGMLQSTGKYEEARPLFERALAISEKAQGPEHPDTATSLNNLALLLNSTGKYEEARPLFERALAISEKALGPEHPDTALSLNNLASLLDSTGKYEEARPLFERAIAINEKVLGPDHVSTARSLDNLAGLLESTGKHEEARPLYERALAIREKVQGPEHRDIATNLNNLALLLQSTGKYEEARPLFERALAIHGKVLGPEHPLTATSLYNLALLLLDTGDRADARRRAMQRFEGSRGAALAQAAIASGSDAARWLATQQNALALVVETTPEAERSADELYSDALLVKGGAFRLARERHGELATRLDPEAHEALERLRSVRAATSNLFSVVAPPDRAQHGRDLERLRKERVELETKLARLVDARPDLKPVTPEELRAALPKGAVLFDFVEHAHYEPAEWKNGALFRPGRSAGSRVSVWVSRADTAAPAWVDLGPSAAIESAANACLGAIVADAGASLEAPRGAAALTSAPSAAASRSELARRLRRIVWDPIARLVGDATTVFLAVDGCVATVPFGVLEEDDGRHLLESHEFRAIEDAASFARSRSVSAPIDSTLLCIGGIDYDSAGAPPRDLVAHADLRGSFSGSWPRLTHTEQEADAIGGLHAARFASVPRTVLHGQDPSEERLKQELGGARYVHLATHGYFVVDGLKSIADSIREEPERGILESRERSLLAGYWPEFLCGIVCAGANDPKPGRDNGLLTGDEVSGLDLSKCDLVVLSACETALGKRQAGEGMLSLTRSFRIAGARTVISSLWQVRDDSTKELMLDFYDRLWNKKESKLDALRHAQLAMLRRNREKYGDTRPVSWGAFVLTGDAE